MLLEAPEKSDFNKKESLWNFEVCIIPAKSKSQYFNFDNIAPKIFFLKMCFFIMKGSFRKGKKEMRLKKGGSNIREGVVSTPNDFVTEIFIKCHSDLKKQRF